MCQAVNMQGRALSEVLPPTSMLQLIMVHPLRVQVSLYFFFILFYCFKKIRRKSSISLWEKMLIFDELSDKQFIFIELRLGKVKCECHFIKF